MKYLFTVEYTDGTEFKQNKKDISEIDPKRSCFYDVLQSKKEIKKFTLGRLFDKWSVDLETGEFTHNGYRFVSEENPKPGKRELIFFRQHQHDMNVKGQEVDHRITYFLGFKQGKKKQIVGIK